MNRISSAVGHWLTVLFLCAPLTLQGNSASDEKQLKALDQAYANEWLAGNETGVMNLFTSDATLVPHHGDTPIKGHKNIRDFWFNPSNPPTVIPEWTRTPLEILVLGNTGIIRGRARLVWEYNNTRTTIPESNYVMIATRPTQEAPWRIRMLTWNDDPRAWIREPITRE